MTSDGGNSVRPAYDAFLSYTSRDRRAVEKVAQHLAEFELKLFFDRRDIAAGRSSTQVLTEALTLSRAMVAFISRGELGPWQEKEISAFLNRHAADRRLRLVPVLLPGAVESDIPLLIRDFHRFDFSGGLGNPAEFDRLAKDLLEAIPRDPGRGRGPKTTPLRSAPSPGRRSTVGLIISLVSVLAIAGGAWLHRTGSLAEIPPPAIDIEASVDPWPNDTGVRGPSDPATAAAETAPEPAVEAADTGTPAVAPVTAPPTGPQTSENEAAAATRRFRVHQGTPVDFDGTAVTVAVEFIDDRLGLTATLVVSSPEGTWNEAFLGPAGSLDFEGLEGRHRLRVVAWDPGQKHLDVAVHPPLH